MPNPPEEDEQPASGTTSPVPASQSDSQKGFVPDREPSVNVLTEQAGTGSVANRAFLPLPPQDRPSEVPPKKVPAAEWVLAIREFLHLTQEKFAALLGVDRSAVAKWETGLARPRYDSQQKIRAVAPPELRDVGVIQDRSLPEDPLAAEPSMISLIRAVDSWADAAGIRRPTEDNEFFDRLVAAYTDYRKRITRSGKQ